MHENLYYVELVKALRYAGKNQNCFECAEGERTEGECSRKCIFTKAADVIQRLLDVIQKLLTEVEHWELEAAANETDRQYLIDENRKLVDSLMPLLTPHGDLIDKDKVFERYKHDPEKPEICDGAQDLDWLIQCLSEAPVIVPANS